MTAGQIYHNISFLCPFFLLNSIKHSVDTVWNLNVEMFFTISNHVGLDFLSPTSKNERLLLVVHKLLLKHFLFFFSFLVKSQMFDEVGCSVEF